MMLAWDLALFERDIPDLGIREVVRLIKERVGSNPLPIYRY